MALVATAAAQPQGSAPKPPDPGKLAQTLVTQCAGIGEGDKVMISGGTRDLVLLEELAIAARKLGAHPLLTLETEALARRMFTDVPAKLDAQERALPMALAQVIDAYIYIDYLERTDLLADIPAERVHASAKADLAFGNALLKRDVRQVYLGNALYPTKARAEMYGLTLEDLARIFWNGVNVDYTQLRATGEKVQKQLAACNELKVTAPNGTHLTLKIPQRPVFLSDGVVSAKDRAQGGAACQAWLPAGEVYVTAVPGTANGVFIADHYFFEGKPIDGLKLEFKDGKLTTMTAKGDLSPLKQRYEAAPSGRDAFAFIDVGINPNVEIPPNSRLVTWMGAGTISIGTGDDTWAGGNNACPFSISAMLNGGTLTLDGQPLVDNGKLVLAEVD